MLAHGSVAFLNAALFLGKKRGVDNVDVAILHDVMTLLDRHIAPTFTDEERTHSESPTLRL